MKKNILYFLIAFLFVAVACNEDEKVEFYDLGSEFLISSSGYTSLDNEVTLTIENQQANLSAVTITHLGGLTSNEDADGELIPFTSTYTGTISISGGEGSITLTDAQLGMTEIDWSADFQFDAVYDGKPFPRYKTITVEDPISVEDPGVTHRSDTTYYFKFAIEPATATVETVSVETKVGVNATYVDAGTFNAEDSLAIVGTADGKNVGDTLFVKVTGTVGTKSATTVTKVIIAPYSYENTATYVLDMTADLAIDLIKGRSIESTVAYGDSADIEITTTVISGGYTMGFAALNNAEFVMGTSDDYANGDMYDAVNADFSSPITSDDDVAVGDVYFYRTKRGTGSYHYGIMKISKVDKPQGVMEDSSIEITVKN